MSLKNKKTNRVFIRHWSPGAILGISSDGDDGRIFLGLKFSILGFFWVRKFGKYFFGQLDLSRDFLGVLKRIGCLELFITLLLKQNRSWVSLAPALAC